MTRSNSTFASRAILRRPGEADMVDNPLAGSVAYRARSEETAGAVTVLESVVAPGEGPPLHVHVNEDEFIYVLEGRLRVRLEEAVREAPAGSFVFIPKGVSHTWKNAGDGAARFPVWLHAGGVRHGALLRAWRGGRGRHVGRRGIRKVRRRRGHGASRPAAGAVRP